MLAVCAAPLWVTAQYKRYAIDVPDNIPLTVNSCYAYSNPTRTNSSSIRRSPFKPMSDIRSCIDDVWSDFNEAINVTDTDADRARVVASITQLAQRLQFASDADKQHAAVVACETLLAASAARIEYPDPESLVWLNQVISQLVPLVPQDHYNKRIRLCSTYRMVHHVSNTLIFSPSSRD